MREFRKFNRVDVCEKIELVCDGCSYRGYLDNLSVNGALVELDDDTSIAPGQSCILSIYLEEDDEGEAVPPLQLRSEAVHGYSSLVGMRFLDCDDETRGRLFLLMDRLESEPQRLENDLERIRGYLAEYHDYCDRAGCAAEAMI